MRRIGFVSFSLVLGLSGSSGCAATNAAVPVLQPQNRESTPARDVTDANFPKLAYELLLGGRAGGEHQQLLRSVVSFQASRAEAAFASGQGELGLSILHGALRLVHRNEFQPEMLSNRTLALVEAASRTSVRGQTGQALAFYTLLNSLLEPESSLKADVQAHLAALSSWTAADKAQSRVLWRGAQHRTYSQLALLYPTQENFDAATSAGRQWILEGLKTDLGGPKSADLDRDEAIESYRAIKTGAIALVGLYLRDGDAKGALGFIKQNDLVRLIPPAFQERLEAAADENPEAWSSLYQFFSAATNSDRPELALESALADGAAWGSALELHRTLPGSFAAAAPLCDELLRHGLSEVVPLIVSDTLGDNASPQDVSMAMSFIWRALANAGDSGSPEAARRILAASKDLLSQAERLQGRVRPSATTLYYVMGALEKRAGELEAARTQFQTAARLEPSVEALTALADIDRQRGAPRTSLQSLEQAERLAEKSGSLLTQAETQLKSFEILREIADAAEAEKALRAALKNSLAATRITGSDTAKVRSELLLARVLIYYGEPKGAHRALDRAWEVSQSSLANVTTTLLEAGRQALTQRDLPAAREATRRAIGAKLSDEDLIYVTLWLMLLERELQVASDGTVEEALALMSESTTWPGQLRAWARGKLSLEELAHVAKGPIERTEAAFYATLAKRGRVPVSETEAGLNKVADSVAIELVEVAVARDLLLASKGRMLKFTVPADVTLP